jgi:four helix bundle protein
MGDNSGFIRQKGNFRELIVFRKAECIYDVTFFFTHKFLEKGDRSIYQMVQAARSGKQNIAEGCSASTTSTETEIKLINVARASLQELLLDYEDYLRVRNLQQWPKPTNASLELVRYVLLIMIRHTIARLLSREVTKPLPILPSS